MLIVHVVRQFHPGVGGLENVVLELASAQVKAGHRVRVVTLDRLFNDARRQKLPPSETLDGIEIVRIPYFGSSRYPIAFSALRHIKDADLVHVHAIDFFFDYLAWTKPLHGRKLVVSTHGGFFHTTYAALLKRVWFHTLTRLSLQVLRGRRRGQRFRLRTVQHDPLEGNGLHRERRERLDLPGRLGSQVSEVDHLHRALCQEQAHRSADRIRAIASAPRS